MEESLGITKAQYKSLVKYISDNMKVPVLGAGGGFAPLGCINAYMGTVAPQGWIICNGQIVNISDYPELAAHFASQLGSSNVFGGDGATTFAMPDLRGEFLRGSGTNGHTNQGNGANVGVHQNGTSIPTTFTANGTYIYSYKNGNNGSNAPTDIDKVNTFSDAYVTYVSGTSGKDAQAYSYTSRPTNTSVLYIIKATVSDTELDNMHVYSPNEHKVGWWQEEVGGVLKQKPVYEKTVITPSLSVTKGTSSYVVIAQSATELELKECKGTFVRDSTRWIIDNIVYNDAGTSWSICSSSSQTSSGTIRVRFQQNVSSDSITLTNIQTTIRYTKTTDQWQTV